MIMPFPGNWVFELLTWFQTPMVYGSSTGSVHRGPPLFRRFLESSHSPGFSGGRAPSPTWEARVLIRLDAMSRFAVFMSSKFQFNLDRGNGIHTWIAKRITQWSCIVLCCVVLAVSSPKFLSLYFYFSFKLHWNTTVSIPDDRINFSLQPYNKHWGFLLFLKLLVLLKYCFSYNYNNHWSVVFWLFFSNCFSFSILLSRRASYMWCLHDSK